MERCCSEPVHDASPTLAQVRQHRPGISVPSRLSRPSSASDSDQTLSDESVTRYRVDVVARSIAEVVRFAGGWLCDRALSGWDIRVLTDESDCRPLRILGASPVDRLSVMAPGEPQPGTLAVSAALYESEPKVRADVTRARAHPHLQVLLLADASTTLQDSHFHPARRRMTSAAQAFKVVALSAIGETPHEVADSIEVFRIGTQRLSAREIDDDEFF